MKKVLFLLITLSFFTNTTECYSQSHLGINAMYAYPTGNFKDFASHGYGGNINTKFFVGPKVTLGLTGAFLRYSQTQSYISYRALPLTLEGEYYFTEYKIRPYIAFSGGLMLLTRTEKYKSGSIAESEGYFTMSPMTGVLFDISKSAALNFNVKYLMFFINSDTWASLAPSLGIYYKIGER